MVSHGSITDNRGIKIEMFITHRSERKYLVYLKGLLREIKADRLQTERQDVGHMPLRGFLGGELCEVSGLSLDWPIQIKSVGVWLVGQGSFPRGTKTKVLGGTLDHQGCWGYQECTFTCDSAGC